jgi:hypothetical protein
MQGQSPNPGKNQPMIADDAIGEQMDVTVPGCIALFVMNRPSMIVIEAILNRSR